MTMTSKCVHYWLLDGGRPRASAVCRLCGDSRTFTGGFTPESISWRGQPTAGTSVARARRSGAHFVRNA